MENIWELPRYLSYHYSVFSKEQYVRTIDWRKSFSSKKQADEDIFNALADEKPPMRKMVLPYILGKKEKTKGEEQEWEEEEEEEEQEEAQKSKVVFKDLLASHILCGGITGAGKTNNARTLVTSLMHYAHPEYLKIVIFDPKYTGFEALSGICNIYNKYQDMVSVLAALGNILEKRKSIAAESLRVGGGSDVKEINAKAYQRRQPDKVVPYIFVLIDEFTQFSENAKSNKEKEAIQNLMNLVSQGRSLGIRLMLMAQSIYAHHLQSFVKGNIDLRMSFRLKCKKQEGLIFRGDKDPSVTTLRLPRGSFLVAEDYGRNARYKALLCRDKTIKNAGENLYKHGFDFRLFKD